jgi:tRNA (guanine-N7-)-methyltransferase
VTARDLPAVSSPAGGCEVEIGCGNGHFLSSYAAEKPDTLLIGIDIKEKRCVKAREKAEKRGLRNVSIIHGSAEAVLRDLLPGSVDAFHIYFPDPWPKSRHRKRRFFTMENLNTMHQLLRTGGKLFFGTDFFDYYLQAKVLVALHQGFRISEESAPDSVLTSLYGQKFAGASKQIHLFSAVRRGSSNGQGQHQEQEWNVHQEIQRNEGS